MKVNGKLLIVLLVLMVAGLASAADYVSFGRFNLDNDNWLDADTWYYDTVDPDWTVFTSPPGELDDAYVIDDSAGSIHPVRVAGTGAVAGNLGIGIWGYQGTLIVDQGGELGVTFETKVNWDRESDATLIVDGGTFTTPVINVGTTNPTTNSTTGKMIINSGTVDLTSAINMNIWGTANGSIDIYGGTLTTPVLNLGAGGKVTIWGGTIYVGGLSTDTTAEVVIDIHAGSLVIDGDHVTVDNPANPYPVFIDWPEAGILVAFDGNGTLVADYDVTNAGKTTITAIGSYDCLNPPVGDLTGDCVVDLADIAEMAMSWLECGRSPVTECP